MSDEAIRRAEAEYLSLGVTPDMIDPRMPGGRPGYMNGVRKERSHWRDEEISERHRDYGVQCAAVDGDFTLYEYVSRRVVAIAELKWCRAKYVDLDGANINAQRDLAHHERGLLPLWIAWYWKNPWAYCIHPLNSAAEKLFTPMQRMSEYDYVRQLYTVRQRTFELAFSREKLSLSVTPPPFDGFPIRTPDRNGAADQWDGRQWNAV